MTGLTRDSQQQRSLTVEVTLENTASESEIAAIKAAFERAQVDAAISASYQAKSFGAEVVIALVVLVAVPYLKAFFGKLGELHGEAFNDVMRNLVNSLSRGRTKPVVESRADQLEILLEDDLPDEAWRQLRDGEFPSEAELNQLRFDRNASRWRDAFDLAKEEFEGE